MVQPPEPSCETYASRYSRRTPNGKIGRDVPVPGGLLENWLTVIGPEIGPWYYRSFFFTQRLLLANVAPTLSTIPTAAIAAERHVALACTVLDVGSGGRP